MIILAAARTNIVIKAEAIIFSSFVFGMTKTEFNDDAKTQSAVILQLALIGEVSKKISPETKELVDLPWKEIAGFRDNAIHNYFEVDINLVWNTLIVDLPLLKTELQKIV